MAYIDNREHASVKITRLVIRWVLSVYMLQIRIFINVVSAV